MLKKVILLGLVAFVSARTKFQRGPVFRRYETDRIVGGEEVEPHSVPYIAANLQGSFQTCASSIVNEDTLITAAHCSDYVTRIAAGKHLLSESEDSEQIVNVAEVIDHPDYGRPSYFANDIAIIKLSAPLEFNDKVNGASLPEPTNPGEEPYAGEDADVFGWGNTRSNELRGVTVPIVSDEECGDAYGSDFDADTMICSGQAGQDACQGDSGGPMVLSGTDLHIGVVSWGNGCGLPGYPGVYAETQRLLDFVNEHI